MQRFWWHLMNLERWCILGTASKEVELRGRIRSQLCSLRASFFCSRHARKGCKEQVKARTSHALKRLEENRPQEHNSRIREFYMESEACHEEELRH